MTALQYYLYFCERYNKQVVNFKLIYIAFIILLPNQANGQEINKMKRQFDVKRSDIGKFPERDSSSVHFDAEYEDWLKNEPLKMDTLSTRFQDYINPKTDAYDLLNQKTPEMTYKFDNSFLTKGNGTYSVVRNLDIVTGASSNNIPGLLQSRSANFDLRYHTGNFTLSGGTTLSKYQNFIWNKNAISFHANAEYQISDRLSFGLQGSFVPNANHIGPVAPFSATNGYSAYAKIKINSWLALMPSIGRYFDPIRHKWLTSFNIMPAIDFGSLLHLKSRRKALQKAKLKKVLEAY